MDTTFNEKTSAIISEGPGKRFKVAIISEGLGNLGDAYYYTKEALQYAYTNKVFEGAHFFADHPSNFEEANRPERSVGDMYGHYENVMYDVIDGLGTLTANLVLLEGESSDWIGDQLSHALKFSQKYPAEEYIGISINASGDAELTNIDEVIAAAPMRCRDKLQMAKEQGINTIKVTKVINSAISADLVTSAGARGRILQRLESSKQEKIKMSINKEADTEPAPTVAPAPEKHDDEQQDIELIKSMLKKYVGGKGDKEDEAMIRQAAKAYNEMGHPMGEAYEMAAKHIKASKMMKSKEDEAAKKELEKNPPPPEAPAPEKKPDAPEKKDGDPSVKKEEECKDGKAKEEEAEKKEDEAEEGKKKEAALLGEIAALKNRLAEKEFEEYVESTLSKSGMKRDQTSQFRECLEGVTTKKQFDLLFKTFKAGLEGKGSVTFTESNPEKVVVAETKTFSFADCKN